MGWVLLFVLFLVFIPVVGLILRGLLASGVMSPGGGQSTGTPAGHSGDISPLGPAFITGSGEEGFHLDRDDLLTNPVYSHLPGNIFHASEANKIGTGFDPEIGDDLDSGPDYITDPIYSYMPCNIYYSDDLHDPFADDFGTGSTASIFDDDCGGSSIASGFDDNWSSSFSNDDWHSSSFED